MDKTTSAPAGPRDGRQGRNPRGQGERLREDIISAALRLLDELGDDQALSMRAVAREVGVAATSVYIHFADRDTLVLAALERFHRELVEAVDQAETGAADPAGKLRARVLLLGRWVQQHPGLYKVLHESTLNQRAAMSFKQELAERTTAAVQRCIDAGLTPADDAAVISLDLRAAVHGAVSMRVNQPGLPWPPLEEQVDRFLAKLVGLTPTPGCRPE
ncbi:TetR/AcrR family transcriptional regulator [Bailinhaonella thermotolerans]|uniref:TetR/AcrR family transcriptional regulator n=1 Tax=Bailinhaonella thermotolerans TaxID=1070861 RepID=A0A3A4AWS3_9ACTN|nr:TetR/AcrR family transcriptional regulator [Bailinhaonella thermotolerans]RJL23882.1 TetR/AcrR family transcriptional regulator [Bailinhaonella thermotolerans]